MDRLSPRLQAPAHTARLMCACGGPQVPAVPRDFTVGTALRVHEVQQVTIAAKNIEEVPVITIRTRQVRARCFHCLLLLFLFLFLGLGLGRTAKGRRRSCVGKGGGYDAVCVCTPNSPLLTPRLLQHHTNLDTSDPPGNRWHRHCRGCPVYHHRARIRGRCNVSRR